MCTKVWAGPLCNVPTCSGEPLGALSGTAMMCKSRGQQQASATRVRIIEGQPNGS